tara:strand:+ start:4671 stop:5861 length:1191 start_codon:yes stop_codon:yes gene_type:complete
MDLIQLVKEKAAAYKTEVVAIRQHLHQHPELSFKEFKTADFIENKLNEYGVTNQKRLVKTGIIALIEGKNPSKKIIALRSDHDALPIQEENELEYKSINNGVMHACGHDVHTSSLLGVAKILNELKDEFEGTVKLIFQPGEEIIPGGASLIIKEGGLKNPTPTNMFGQHVYPQLEAGKVGFRPGMYMASADEIYVTVKGKGGHAALPQLNIDPILIASHIIVALQQIVSRGAHPTVPTVLSFGKIIGEGATNVIPDEVKLEGTFRTMNEEWRARAHQKMKKMAEDIAEGMGGECIFDIHVGYPFLVNDEELTARAKQGAIEFFGAENVVDLDLRMTAEDFAFYSQVLPTCFYRLGVKSDQKQINSGLHTSTFNIDEDAIETGMGLMAWLTLKELQA